MKIVGISDLHGYLPKELPEGEVLCICGDIFPVDIQRNLIKSAIWFGLYFIPWVNSLSFKKVFMIAGNHDFLLEDLLEERGLSSWSVMDMLCMNKCNKLVILHNNIVTYESITFYGTPYCASLQNWAFYKSHNGLEEAFSKIPDKCDIILTHQPPRYGDLGKVLEYNFNHGENYGCQELTDALENKDFGLLMCGHVHSGEHNVLFWNNRKLVNVSLKNEQYKVSYIPFEIEYDGE